MIPALGLALVEIFEPRMRRVLILGLAIAAAILLALIFGFAVLLHQASPIAGWGFGAAVELLGDVAILVLAWLLFPVVVTTVLGFFLDGAIAVAEEQHYPWLPSPRRVGFAAQLRSALRLAVLGLALNLLALPLYFLLPGLNIVIFYTINGWLLGREFLELVALRRLDETGLRRFRKAHRPRLFAAGIVIAVLMTLPFVNLVAPLVSALFMLHLFERIRQKSKNLY